jgi:hypothetical protein
VDARAAVSMAAGSDFEVERAVYSKNQKKNMSKNAAANAG